MVVKQFSTFFSCVVSILEVSAKSLIVAVYDCKAKTEFDYSSWVMLYNFPYLYKSIMEQ